MSVPDDENIVNDFLCKHRRNAVRVSHTHKTSRDDDDDNSERNNNKNHFYLVSGTRRRRRRRVKSIVSQKEDDCEVYLYVCVCLFLVHNIKYVYVCACGEAQSDVIN